MEKSEKRIHQVFTVSLWLKALNAALEMVLGITLLFTGAVTHLVNLLVHGELIEDPTDFIALHIVKFLPYLSEHSQFFGAFYLLSHGVIKLFLFWGLIRNKLWAYPTSLIFLFLFIIYQVIRYAHTHSIFLIALTLFDICVMWLVWHEYRIVRGRKMAH